MKVFKPNMDSLSKDYAREEYRVAQMLRGHPNIVTIGSFEKQQPITVEGQVLIRDYLTMEYCANSDLFQFMGNYGKRQETGGLLKT